MILSFGELVDLSTNHSKGLFSCSCPIMCGLETFQPREKICHVRFVKNTYFYRFLFNISRGNLQRFVRGVRIRNGLIACRLLYRRFSASSDSDRGRRAQRTYDDAHRQCTRSSDRGPVAITPTNLRYRTYFPGWWDALGAILYHVCRITTSQCGIVRLCSRSLPA